MALNLTCPQTKRCLAMPDHSVSLSTESQHVLRDNRNGPTVTTLSGDDSNWYVDPDRPERDILGPPAVPDETGNIHSWTMPGK